MLRSHGYRTSTRRSLSIAQILLLQVYRWVSIAVHYHPLQKRPVSLSSPQSRVKNLPGRILPHPPTVISDSHFLSRPFLPFCYSCISSHDHQLYFLSHLHGHPTIRLSSYSRARGCEGGLCSCHLGRKLVYNDAGVWSATLRVA
jgi:hypothetical protein